ncbi:MAG: molybdopterin-dependent oxidoreductase [Planctomycetales bacterium]|nr:molybdopterin-dependent oxidoreductase [Planctomycetales bacterium]
MSFDPAETAAPNPAQSEAFLREHARATRRYFLQLSGMGAAATLLSQPLRAAPPSPASSDKAALQRALDELEPYLTPQDEFQDVSRGKPKPHSLSDEKKAEVGLTRETWSLEVVSDTDQPARIKRPLRKADNTALTFQQLLEMGKTKAVRFPKVMTCLNIGCPLGMGVWEGVPLREVLWLTEPVENLRRVFYYGYHNDDPEQMFRSSLPVGRVLEDPFDLPPVILCYKLNGEWLSAERGGPVRMVVPEAYGFKSIKWLSHVVLTNLPHANDTYAEKNNDVDSPLKTFCATIYTPDKVKSGESIPLTGWAQSGIAGLSKVQVWIQPRGEAWAEDDPYFLRAPWRDADILPAEPHLGATEPLGPTVGLQDNGQAEQWPLRLTKAHWATLHPGLPAGQYVLRCRTVDGKGVGQPLPRPFRKSGHAAIEQHRLVVE